MFGRYFSIGLLTAALMGSVGTAHAGGRQIHVVYTGQRLGSIAKRYNVSIAAICEANGISRRDPIHPGQRLEIPSRDELQKGVVNPPKSSAPGVDAKSQPEASSKATVVATAKLEAASKVTKPEPPVLSKTSVPQVEKTSTTTKAPEVKAQGNEATAVTKLVTPGKKGSSTEFQPPVAAKAALAHPTTPTAATLGTGPLFAGVSHRIQPGESLSAIAVRYDTNVKTLLEVNNLRKDQVIRAGQLLTIPKAAGSGTWWGKFARAPRQYGEIEVFAQTNRWKGKIVVNGKVQPAGRAALSRLLGATGNAPPIPERLIKLLSHVSDTFGGRPVRLVSGYRTNSYVKDSRHRHSCAVDFSIPGVPNSAVRDYLLQLGDVGVGYYPNSTFVHLDVRARSAYWVDYAGPGEAPRKQPRADRRFARNTNKPKTAAPIRSRRAVKTYAPAAVPVSSLIKRTPDAMDVIPSPTLAAPDATTASNTPPANAPGT